jgi:drug/metabolite transporter (DMT)-like permease
MPPVLVGAALMLLTAVVQVVDSIVVRYLAEELHPLEIVFFRNLFSLLALAPLLSRQERSLRANGLWPLHATRAVLKIAALTAAFAAISLLPLSVFTAIAFTTPLFVALGATLFLGEPLRPSRMAAILAGFVGVVVVLRPTEAPVGLGALLALGAAAALAVVVGGAIILASIVALFARERRRA